MPFSRAILPMFGFLVFLLLLISISPPALADDLNIEYCYCRTPHHQRAWVKHFNYTSHDFDDLFGRQYIWNAKCGPEPRPKATDEEHCFAERKSPWALYNDHDGPRGHNIDHERFEHCHRFEDDGTEICTNGYHYSFDGHKIDKLPGHDWKEPDIGTVGDEATNFLGPKCNEWEYDHPDKTVEVLTDCTDDCRYALPEIRGIESFCNITDRALGYEVPFARHEGDVCRKMSYHNLKYLD